MTKNLSSHAATKAGSCTCFRARKLARLLSQRYDRDLVVTGLTVNQFSILRHAARRRHSISSLARALGMDRSTLSRELTPLRAAGWLALKPGADARQREIHLRPSGHEQIKLSQAAWRKSQRALAADLGETELARLHEQLDRAIACLSPDPSP